MLRLVVNLISLGILLFLPGPGLAGDLDAVVGRPEDQAVMPAPDYDIMEELDRQIESELQEQGNPAPPAAAEPQNNQGDKTDGDLGQ